MPCEFTCPDPVRLRQLLEEALPQSERDEIDTHLKACATCRQILERLLAGRQTRNAAEPTGAETPRLALSGRLERFLG